MFKNYLPVVNECGIIDKAFMTLFLLICQIYLTNRAVRKFPVNNHKNILVLNKKETSLIEENSLNSLNQQTIK